MDFGEAVEFMKIGRKMKRKGWSGNNQYVMCVSDVTYRDADRVVHESSHKDSGNLSLLFVSPKGSQFWLASQTDILANDWTFFE